MQEQLLRVFSAASFLRVFPEGGWLVGGAVRNTILGRPIKDYDIKVNLSFEEVVARMKFLNLVRTQNIDLADDEYYVNEEARAVSFLLEGVDVDITSTHGMSISELVSLGDINFSCCAWDISSGEILTPEYILPIKYRMLRFCDPAKAESEPLIIVNALKQISLSPRIYLPPLTLRTLRRGLPSVIALLETPSHWDYKLRSFMGNINSREVYELFNGLADMPTLMQRFDLRRAQWRVPIPYQAAHISNIAEEIRARIADFLSKIYGKSFNEAKLFSPQSTFAIWLEADNGELEAVLILENTRIYSVGGRSIEVLVKIIKDFISCNVGLWGTVDVKNTKMIQIVSDAGMYPETDPAIVDKILRYEYPKYGKGLEINVDREGQTIFIDPETGYAQVLFRN